MSLGFSAVPNFTLLSPGQRGKQDEARIISNSASQPTLLDSDRGNIEHTIQYDGRERLSIGHTPLLGHIDWTHMTAEERCQTGAEDAIAALLAACQFLWDGGVEKEADHDIWTAFHWSMEAGFCGYLYRSVFLTSDGGG